LSVEEQSSAVAAFYKILFTIICVCTFVYGFNNLLEGSLEGKDADIFVA